MRCSTIASFSSLNNWKCLQFNPENLISLETHIGDTLENSLRDCVCQWRYKIGIFIQRTYHLFEENSLMFLILNFMTCFLDIRHQTLICQIESDCWAGIVAGCVAWHMSVIVTVRTRINVVVFSFICCNYFWLVFSTPLHLDRQCNKLFKSMCMYTFSNFMVNSKLKALN